MSAPSGQDLGLSGHFSCIVKIGGPITAAKTMPDRRQLFPLEGIRESDCGKEEGELTGSDPSPSE